MARSRRALRTRGRSVQLARRGATTPLPLHGGTQVPFVRRVRHRHALLRQENEAALALFLLGLLAPRSRRLGLLRPAIIPEYTLSRTARTIARNPSATFLLRTAKKWVSCCGHRVEFQH